MFFSALLGRYEDAPLTSISHIHRNPLYAPRIYYTLMLTKNLSRFAPYIMGLCECFVHGQRWPDHSRVLLLFSTGRIIVSEIR